MSTWSDNLKIELLGIGDTNWGNLTNNNFKWAIEDSITGYATAAFPSDADYDWYLGYTNSNSSQAQRCLVINVTGSLTQTRNLVVPTIEKQYIIQNNTTGSQSIIVKTDAGTGVTVPNGRKAHLFVDGTNVVQMDDYDVTRTIGTLSLTNALGASSGGTGLTALGTGVSTALGQNVTGSGGIVLATSPTLGGVTVAGDITITGTGRRITGDFSNATLASRVMFQTSTTNGATVVSALPNGTSTDAALVVYNGNDPANSASGSMYANAADVRIAADKLGTGTYLPMTLYTNGSERVRIDTSGNVGIGTSSPRAQTHIFGAGQVTANLTDAGSRASMLRVSQDSSASGSGGAILFANNQGDAANSVGFAAIKGLLVNGNNNTSGDLAFSIRKNTSDTSLTECMRIDSSGNVGIGTSSPVGRLDITSGTARMYFSNQTATAFFTAVNTTNTAYAPLAINGSELILKTGDSTRITINGSGYTGINQTPDGNATFQVKETGSSAVRVAEFYLAVASSTSTPAVRVSKYDNDTTTSNKFVDFTINQLNNGSGQINANGASQAAFGTFSDIRLKENIQGLPPQLSNICALRPVEFDYKDGSGHQIGFIAQEMQQVYPDVVGVDRDEMLTVTGWDKTTSRLVKAIQEQQAIIEQLTQRIAALEGA